MWFIQKMSCKVVLSVCAWVWSMMLHTEMTMWNGVVEWLCGNDSSEPQGEKYGAFRNDE